MTVSFAFPAGCVAPKNIVLAGPPPAAGARSIFAPQLPQNRLSAGSSAPQFGQFRTAMGRSILDVGETVNPPASPETQGHGGFFARASSAAARTTACLSS